MLNQGDYLVQHDGSGPLGAGPVAVWVGRVSVGWWGDRETGEPRDVAVTVQLATGDMVNYMDVARWEHSLDVTNAEASYVRALASEWPELRVVGGPAASEGV